MTSSSANTLNFTFDPCPRTEGFRKGWTANLEGSSAEPRMLGEALGSEQGSRGVPREYLGERTAGSSSEKGISIFRRGLDIDPILEFCEIQSTREKAYRHLYNKGTPANETVLAELLALRQEKAVLLGYPNWAAYEMEPGMINNVTDAQIFWLETRHVIDPEADLEFLHMQKIMADRNVDKVRLWDLAYAQNLLKSQVLAGFDPKSTLQYFQVDKVFPGLRDIVQSMFGLRFEEVVNAETWHPSVTAFCIYDTTSGEDKLIGRIFFDLFARDGEQDGFWGTTIRKPILNSQLGEVIVVSSLSSAPGACMSCQQVKEGFRVFGHCVHVLLAVSQYARFSGLTDIEPDFAGMSSQLLGHWLQDPRLFGFATNKDGEKIPEADMVKLLNAEKIGQATLRRRWMVDCRISLQLHIASKDQLSDVCAFVGSLFEEYGKLNLPGDIHPHHGLVALVNGFRGSRLYGRLLAEVIACDIYQVLQQNGNVNLKTYRELILEKGSSRDAKDMINDLLGRPYGLKAFGDWLHSTTQQYEKGTAATK